MKKRQFKIFARNMRMNFVRKSCFSALLSTAYQKWMIDVGKVRFPAYEKLINAGGK